MTILTLLFIIQSLFCQSSPSANGAFYQASQPQMQLCLPHMNSGSEVCSIFFKAFDSVPHCSLIAKLSLLNISDFYSSESLTTWQIEVSVLELKVLPPHPYQFSLVFLKALCLAPYCMFKIHIDGLNNVLSNCSMHLYADDLLLYRPIHFLTDYQALQANIDALSDSISAHKLQFNCDKCNCTLVSWKRDPTMPVTLLVKSQNLERAYSYKYLGILLTFDLSWSAHISTLFSKARQQIGMLYISHILCTCSYDMETL